MNSKLQNILTLGCKLSDSDYAYLLAATDAEIKMLGLSENFDADTGFLTSFNKELFESTIKQNVPLENLNSFKKIEEALGFKSIFYTHLTQLNDTSYILIFLSGKENNYDGVISNELSTYFESVKEVIDLIAESDLSGKINFDLPILITDPKGNLVNLNKIAAKLFGLKPPVNAESLKEELIFMDEDNAVIPFEKLPFNTVLVEEKTVSDIKLKYKDGESNQYWFRANSIPAFNDNGKIEQVITSLWDISGIMEIEGWFRETAQNISSVLYSTDAEGRKYNFISDAVTKIFGFAKEEIINNRVSLLRKIDPDYIKDFRSFINKLKSGETASIEYKILGDDSTEFFVRHTGSPIIKDGKILRIVGSITNVTDEIKYRSKLEKSEERFRLLIETAEDLIFTLNSYGYFVSVNTIGAKGLGYTPEEMIGKHFLEFVDEESKSDIAIAFQNILSREELTRFDVQITDKFENSQTYEINARSIKTNGATSGMIGIGREISERIKNEKKLKELNSKLIEANRLISIEQDRAKQQISVLEELNRLKNEFISNVSHELRTPLASIVGFAETLASDDDLPEDLLKEFSQVIYTEGKRLARLINDILDFSKLENNKDSLEKSTFNIISVLRELAAKWQKQMNQKGLTFHVEIPDAEIKLNADKERITKAIGNLLSNAVKFTNKGGRVSFLARDFLKEVEIIISDTGVGIPKEEIPKLFQKFSKVNRAGTQIPGAGFGLTAVKQIIDLHEGLIKVKSEFDKGSTFIIKLPKK